MPGCGAMLSIMSKLLHWGAHLLKHGSLVGRLAARRHGGRQVTTTLIWATARSAPAQARAWQPCRTPGCAAPWQAPRPPAYARSRPPARRCTPPCPHPPRAPANSRLSAAGSMSWKVLHEIIWRVVLGLAPVEAVVKRAAAAPASSHVWTQSIGCIQGIMQGAVLACRTALPCSQSAAPHLCLRN